VETPWLPTMYPATAAALTVVGLALLLWRRPREHRRQPRHPRLPQRPNRDLRTGW
jgi:hypothetical protein